MRQAIRFPVDYLDGEHGQRETTFVPLAIPPRHDLVASVFGWVFHGDELLLVRRRDGEWSLPGGPRKPGETLGQTLARTVWDETGALLAQDRMIGALKTTIVGPEHVSVDVPAAELSVGFIAEAHELLPFSPDFDAEERLLIDPGLVQAYVKPWSPLMDEMLNYARSVRTPSRVVDRPESEALAAA